MGPRQPQGTAGILAGGEGCGSSRPAGGGGTFGECLGGDSRSWSLAAGEGQMPGVPLSPSQAGGLGHPCFLLMPTVALKVSSVLEGPMLFLALHLRAFPGKAEAE